MSRSIKTFNDVRKYLRNIAHIGHGGCGVAALAMKRWARQNLNKDINIIFGFRHNCENLYNQNSEAIETNNSNMEATSCSHAGIIFETGKRVQDVFDDWSPESYEYKLVMPENIAVAALNDTDRWNPEFNRNEWVPEIAKALEINLSDVTY